MSCLHCNAEQCRGVSLRHADTQARRPKLTVCVLVGCEAGLNIEGSGSLATSNMDSDAVSRRILLQRMGRYSDTGPNLDPAGSARFRQEFGRLRVGFADLVPGRAPIAVYSVVAFARPRGMSVQWVTMPERSGEEELPPALLAAGFSCTEHLLLMAHDGEVAAELNPAVAVAPITTWQAMWAYEYGSRQAFFDDPAPAQALVTQRAQERWREQEYGWCRYFVASVRGRAVGGCYVSLFEEVPTIMGVYTLPEAQRQGVATALIVRAVVEVAQMDRPVCCLFVRHENPAKRLYRSLGFQPLLTEDTYMWYPSN